jgi:hypothetical protein
MTGVVSSRRLRLDPDPGGADSLRKIDIESVLWWYDSLPPESAKSGSHGCGFTMQNIHTYMEFRTWLLQILMQRIRILAMRIYCDNFLSNPDLFGADSLVKICVEF